ncbi:MAG TPA: hypothetical protein VFF28_00180 [Candidatus Nanoarchaeia archaeon]|nr:hypothetical protein [Candidatus Nanoarchaeia archaeon]
MLEELMPNFSVDSSGVTLFRGLELSEQTSQLMFVPHIYRGKEPTLQYIYHQIREVAQKLGIDPHLSAASCSDEENSNPDIHRTTSWGRIFRQYAIGNLVLSQPTSVSLKQGHSSTLFEINGHSGVYKHKDGRILLGKVESQRDNILRPTCGALSHVIKRFLGQEIHNPSEEGVDLVGELEKDLHVYKEEFLNVYHSGRDTDEKLSKGMEYIVTANIKVQTEKTIRYVREAHLAGPAIVFSTMTLNRFKYPETCLLLGVYLIKDGQTYDLTKHPV